MSSNRSDVLWLSVLFLATGCFALACVDFTLPPVEDAAILMRYARHLAQGHGIVWNIGEPPIDGATDFLFMVAVAAVHRAGVPPETSVHVLTVAAHFLTVALIYLALRHVQGAGVWAALASALYVAVGPGLPLAASYFGTPFFALWITVAWILGQRVILGEKRGVVACMAFAFAALVAGLTRPEGVLIASFMLVGFCLALPVPDARRLVVAFAGVFGLFGGAYFVWRWRYFGYPLPNPFYKKGAGLLYPRSLAVAVFNVFVLCSPFLAAFPFALRSRRTLTLAFAFAVPLVGSTVMWLLLSPEMNFASRFQYPILCIAALSWFPLVRTLRTDAELPRLRDMPPRARAAIRLAALTATAGVLAMRVHASISIKHPHVGAYDVALILRDYAGRGLTMATTEAGLLPLYSEWRAIDVWGLNDAWIAHSGTVTDAYLHQQHPAVVMWHASFLPVTRPEVEHNGPWAEMVTTLKRYVQANDYRLVAAFGRSPLDTHSYYVRADLAEGDEISARVRSTTYLWLEGSEPATDFAAMTR